MNNISYFSSSIARMFPSYLQSFYYSCVRCFERSLVALTDNCLDASLPSNYSKPNDVFPSIFESWSHGLNVQYELFCENLLLHLISFASATGVV